LVTACTVLLDRSQTQCATNTDCAKYRAGAVCVSGFCAIAADAGTLGPPGCFSGVPATDEDYLNQCTASKCLPFDNCARLGLCDGGVPALVPPPPPGPAADAGAPSNPTIGCYDQSLRPRPIFMQGSTNFTPFVQAVAAIVAGNNYTIVWQPTSSCAGAGAGGFTAAPGDRMTNPTNATQTPAAFYDPNGNATPCLLGNSPTSPDGQSEITDIGESDVFSTTCNPAWVPGGSAFPDVGSYLGPIASYVFVTPAASTQRVISAEAARLAFGLGGDNGVSAPWVDPNAMLVRSASTGTNNILSLGINVPPAAWWGITEPNAQNVQSGIIGTSQENAEKTIGTLSIDWADPVKTSLTILFYQATGQRCGFLPDSSPAASDKINVRDGHYPLWGPIHLYTRLVASAATAQASALILPFNQLNKALIDATIKGGDVPQCAMYVQRRSEMGPLEPYTPTHECYCYYESQVSGGTHCQPCNGPADCPASRPACSIGYCEVQ
jgi:hypothetical protein